MIKLQALQKSPIYKQPTKRIQDKIIYPTTRNLFGTIEHKFVMIDTKSGKQLGMMICLPTKVYRKNLGEVKSLFIAYLSAAQNLNKGVGKTFFNFAKKYSKQTGCNGHIHLESYHSLKFDKGPHTFYRKMGMSTDNEMLDSILDWNLKTKDYSRKEEFPILRMYYPPINIKPTNKTPLHKKFIQNFKKLF